MARRFRFRVREGNAVMSYSTDSHDNGFAAEAGQEIVLSEEEAAAFLKLGRRAVELLEVIDDQPPSKKRLPG